MGWLVETLIAVFPLLPFGFGLIFGASCFCEDVGCQRCASPIDMLSVTIAGVTELDPPSESCDCDAINGTYLTEFSEAFSSTSVCVFCGSGGACTDFGAGVNANLIYPPSGNRVQVGLVQMTSGEKCIGGAIGVWQSAGDPCRVLAGPVTCTRTSGGSVCNFVIGSTAVVEAA